jgi:hypothetical protein
MYKVFFTVFLIFFPFFNANAQEDYGFQFENSNKRFYKINFVNFNNLIIVEIKLNGKPLNFLLDTGVNSTVVFGIEDDQDAIKEQSEKILIKGVSGAKETYAYKTVNNSLEIGNLKDPKHVVYAIFDKDFNLSDKIGYPVQGIIGYDFFENHLIEINYIKNQLKVYNTKLYPNKLKRYSNKDIRLLANKPYIKTTLNQVDEDEDFVFLLDSGSGDAIWVSYHEDMKLPKRNFDDILGYGFAKIVKGKKAKALHLDKYTLESPKIAYPDSSAYKGLPFTNKSGSLGSEVMRRFHWIFDYRKNKVYFKANSDFSDPFNYDMSGLVLKYDGFQEIARFENLFADNRTGVQTDNSAGYNKISFNPKITIELRPILLIDAIRPNSSAYEAGFVEGDKILKINGRDSHKYNLEQIFKILSSKEGETIKLHIERNGIVYNKSLTLKSRFSESD